MPSSGEREDAARRAFGDVAQSILAHGRAMETFNIEMRKNGTLRNRAMVLAGGAGACVGAAGLGLCRAAPGRWARLAALPGAGPPLLMAAAMAGLGLAVVATTSFALERAIYDLELRREVWEIENHLGGELQEMIAIYKTQGLTEEEALVVTRIFAKDKTLFANLMMVEELGYSRLTPPRLSEAAVNVGVPTVLGFVAGVFIPISSLFLQRSLRRPGGGAAAGDFGDSRAHRLTSLLPRPLVRFLGELTLAACCAILGALNTEVFFGAYSHFKLRMKLIAMSLAGAGSVYALSFITTKCF